MLLNFANFGDVESLLNCRLVCKYWKKATDKPSIYNLLQRSTFNIYDWHSFYDKLIDVVKTVRIILPWKDKQHLFIIGPNLLTELAKLLKTTTFDFQQPTYTSNEEFRVTNIIHSMLAECRQLK